MAPDKPLSTVEPDKLAAILASTTARLLAGEGGA